MLAENKSISTAAYGDTVLDTTLMTLNDLNEVKFFNNDELYYNNPQVMSHKIQVYMHM